MDGTYGPEEFRAKQFDVFVSYKRDDGERRDVLIAALEASGLAVWWDTELRSGPWRRQLADMINDVKAVVALWSRAAEAAPGEVEDEMAQARGLDKLVALKTDDASAPKRFREQNFMPFTFWADAKAREPQLAAIVDEVWRRVARPRLKVVDASAAAVIPVAFGDIPGAPDKLIGRDAEMAMLQRAWDSATPKKINAVVLHALGGAGKSALLRTFANKLLSAGGGGAARVYGWSAYSQGSGEQKRADAEGFISQSLGEFGYRGALPKDPVERARALADLVQRERVLLLLDGLEPLQEAPNVNKGRFKDRGLAELVKRLAAQNPGLMVLTTRQEIPELEGFQSLVVNHGLEELSPPAGAELLVELGVSGPQRELEAAVEAVEGHALSVTLLGTYLAEVCDGDIRHRDQFDFTDVMLSPEEQSELLTDKTIIPAKRAAKVMRGYLEQFDKLAGDGASAGLGGPERALLHLLGLFDRPAEGAAVDRLLEAHILGLTDELFYDVLARPSPANGVSKPRVRLLKPEERAARLREAKSRLRKLRLLAGAD
nr:toll/interleukin-1 receptor domain-containing protein [Paracoccaceae bacterium]